MLVVLALVLGVVQDSSLGPRARAMGGAYTAFEDDPLSVWYNPAGIATQPGGLSLSYQTYAIYQEDDSSKPPHHIPARAGTGEPAGIPSYFGAVFEIGTDDRPQALGLCLAIPFFLKLAFDAEDDSLGPNVWSTEQSFMRIRLAYARDFRFRPVGEEGWFPHVSFGLGADVGLSEFDMKDLTRGVWASSDDSDSKYGGAFGLLVGVFDNTRNLKVNLGLAYQSAIEFELKILETEDLRPGPAFTWPDQFQLGILVFLLEGMPLRVTAEVQMVDWRGATQGSDLAGVEDFSRTTTYCLGAEYRWPLAPAAVLFPRIGLRIYDAPWDDDDRADLPGIEEWQLSISTRDDRFVVFTAGFGLSFTLSGGMLASFDAAFEFGGDAPGAALGFGVSF